MSTLRFVTPVRVTVEDRRVMQDQILWCQKYLKPGTWSCYVSHFAFSNAEDATWFALEWSTKHG